MDLTEDLDGPYAFRHTEGTLPDGRRALVIWRTVTGDPRASSAALDAYFLQKCAGPGGHSWDVIFVNGSCSLQSLRPAGAHWDVKLIEPEFRRLMFGEG